MDQEEYTRRLREIKVAKQDVKSLIRNFPAKPVESLDSQNVEVGRRAITDSMKFFDSRILYLVVDLNGEEHEEDATRIANLEQIRREVLDKFLIQKTQIDENI